MELDDWKCYSAPWRNLPRARGSTVRLRQLITLDRTYSFSPFLNTACRILVQIQEGRPIQDASKSAGARAARRRINRMCPGALSQVAQCQRPVKSEDAFSSAPAVWHYRPGDSRSPCMELKQTVPVGRPRRRANIDL